MMSKLRISLATQIMTYFWAMGIIYHATRGNDIDEFAGIEAFVPFGIFVVLTVINLVFFIVYLWFVYKKKFVLEWATLLLAATIVLLIILYMPIISWADAT